MIAVKLGTDPHGFIGRFQALNSNWDDARMDLIRLLIKHPKMVEAYVEATAECGSYDDGNALSDLLSNILTLSESQADRLMSTFNTNPQLQGSYGFNGNWPSKFGPGLATHLTRATGTEFKMTPLGKVQQTFD